MRKDSGASYVIPICLFSIGFCKIDRRISSRIYNVCNALSLQKHLLFLRNIHLCARSSGMVDPPRAKLLEQSSPHQSATACYPYFHKTAISFKKGEERSFSERIGVLQGQSIARAGSF